MKLIKLGDKVIFHRKRHPKDGYTVTIVIYYPDWTVYMVNCGDPAFPIFHAYSSELTVI